MKTADYWLEAAWLLAHIRLIIGPFYVMCLLVVLSHVVLQCATVLSMQCRCSCLFFFEDSNFGLLPGTEANNMMQLVFSPAYLPALLCIAGFVVVSVSTSAFVQQASSLCMHISPNCAVHCRPTLTDF